jgi:hypothetical protein
MSSFIFNDAIPAAGNNPSNDQPIMLANNVANTGIWDVDHIGFNSVNGGKHTTVSFPSSPIYVVPPSPSGNGSVVYVNQGVASTFPQVYFITSQANFSLSLIRAYGIYPGTAITGAVVATNQFNISSVMRVSVGLYAVTLNTNIVTSNTFGVMVTSSFTTLKPNVNIVADYTITGTGTFNLFFHDINSVNVDPTSFTFTVLQI